METFDHELAKKLYTRPKLEEIRDISERMNAALLRLAHDDSIANIDQAQVLFRSEARRLQDWRLKKLVELPGPHGDGTG
jgi:hypothetical protein